MARHQGKGREGGRWEAASLTGSFLQSGERRSEQGPSAATWHLAEEMQQRQPEAYTKEALAEARIEQNCVLYLPKWV